MSRPGLLIPALLLLCMPLAACATLKNDNSEQVTVTHSDEVTLPSMAPDNDDEYQGPTHCDRFLSSLAIAEQKTAQLFHPHAL